MNQFKTILKWLLGILFVLSVCGGIVYFVFMAVIANSIWGNPDDWSIEDEPWVSVSIPSPSTDIEIIYWERHAHPFLAEFERHIEFREDGLEPMIMEMPMNIGGETFINVYSDSNLSESTILILKDIWGSYILRVKDHELEIITAGTLPDASHYLGRIEYNQASELAFISADESSETIIESNE